MSNYTECDRCRCRIDALRNVVLEMSEVNRAHDKSPLKYLDLCRKCAESFNKWLASYPEQYKGLLREVERPPSDDKLVEHPPVEPLDDNIQF